MFPEKIQIGVATLCFAISFLESWEASMTPPLNEEIIMKANIKGIICLILFIIALVLFLDLGIRANGMTWSSFFVWLVH
jgi:hypothetical protein